VKRRHDVIGGINVNENEVTREERLLAALAHGGIVVGGPAPAVSLLVWLAQKDRSDYTAFQALQAAVYQLLGLLVAVTAWSCWTLFYLSSLIPLVNSSAQTDQPPLIFWIGLGSMVLPAGVMALWWLYGLVGAVACGLGRDFQYLLLGRWLRRYLIRGNSAAPMEPGVRNGFAQ